MSAWTPELKAKAVEMYKERNPTPENSAEIVKEIADELEKTANGVRMVLMEDGCYIKKDAASTASTSKTSSGGKTSASTGTKRVSKEDSINALKDKIRELGKEVDDEILDKLTGKAAVYLVSLF